MRTQFAITVMSSLLVKKTITTESSILAVCSGPAEIQLFSNLKFTNVTITSLDPVILSSDMRPFRTALADLRALPYPDKSFDWVFVSDGLHHCDSPHRALVEMYRVSRLGVIVFESRDSLMLQIGVYFGLVETYELSAVIANQGMCAGVNYTCVPNYVYRWTESEFEKTIRCADPTGVPELEYFYGYNPPVRNYAGIRRLSYNAAIVIAKIITFLFRKQSNSFCMIAIKPRSLHPWLRLTNSGLKFQLQSLPTHNTKLRSLVKARTTF